MLHSGFPPAPRLYRLTDARGLPHPVLDELFEGREQALEALEAQLKVALKQAQDLTLKAIENAAHAPKPVLPQG